jgi:hypothetical protein
MRPQQNFYWRPPVVRQVVGLTTRRPFRDWPFSARRWPPVLTGRHSREPAAGRKNHSKKRPDILIPRTGAVYLGGDCSRDARYRKWIDLCGFRGLAVIIGRFGRDWSSGEIGRNGMAIRRWVASELSWGGGVPAKRVCSAMTHFLLFDIVPPRARQAHRHSQQPERRNT